MTILFAWLLADFISGVVHWWEDRAIVGKSRFKFINSIREDNERHHVMPGYFLRYSWWGNINTTAPLAWAIAAILFATNWPTILWQTFFFIGFGNLIHRWSHEPDARIPAPIRWMQNTGLFISPKHHSGHHYNKEVGLVSRAESNRRFCVMTNWLNPILDRIKFFHYLEVFIGKCSF